MTKTISDHAAVAAAIRTELKRHAIKARVTSSIYSGGSSVRVKILADVLPATRKHIESFANQYQSGHFDGMIDCYEYSNSRDDIPQVKFVFVDVEYSDAIREEVRDYIAARFSDTYARTFDADTLAYRIISGTYTCDFWNSRKPRICSANLSSYVCRLCGQRIDDGKACGCGAR